MIALLAAYAAVFGRFRGHKIFLSTSVALMVVPPVTLLVPMFVFMVDTGFVNHLQSVIIFYTGLLGAVRGLLHDELLPHRPAGADRGGVVGGRRPVHGACAGS